MPHSGRITRRRLTSALCHERTFRLYSKRAKLVELAPQAHIFNTGLPT